MHFIGLFAICGAMLAAAFLAFLYELLLWRQKTSGDMLSCRKCFGKREEIVEESEDVCAEEITPVSYYRHRLDAFEQIWNEYLDGSNTQTNTE